MHVVASVVVVVVVATVAAEIEAVVAFVVAGLSVAAFAADETAASFVDFALDAVAVVVALAVAAA